jgi:hypothetical protein
MLLNNKTILLSNYESLFDVLNNKEIDDAYNCKFIYENRIAIQHLLKNDKNSVRIWKTYSLFDWWYNSYDKCGKNFIGIMDYTICDNFIKINHLNINDGRTTLYNNSLDYDDTEELIEKLINFLKLLAKQENKNKIILDVHENLRLYQKYYYNLGFETTNRRCQDNSYWIEVEINL